MQTFKTVIIFPEDDSVEFLRPIVDYSLSVFQDITLFVPANNRYLEIDDDVELVIFLGHGTSSTLFGSLLDNGEKSIFLDVVNASRLFADLSVMLLSCKSMDFIKNIKRNVQLTSFLGFGDMPTDWKHIEYIRESNSEFLDGFEETHLEFYKGVLVNAFINGIRLFHINNTFRAMYLGMHQVINAALSEVIIEKNWPKFIKTYLIELFLELKADIKYF